MKNTNYFFKKGKVSFVMDGTAGSSGKSLLTSYLVAHSNKVDFLLSSFTPNASHTVTDDDGKEFVFKIFAGGSQYHERLKAVYIVDNSAIELKTLWEEMQYLGIPKEKVRISPRCAIVTQIDKDYEAGLCSIDGEYYSKGEERDGTVKTGTTASGSGSVLAKKVIRNKTLVVAKDIPELADMLYSMDEIINRLDNGECGLYEIAQGYPLSMNHHRFAPHTTSRNVTVSNALNDAMIPPHYSGNVFINFRCLPIKIHSKKYKCNETGKFLTWDEVTSRDASKYTVVESYSGDFYPDQREISWDDVTRLSGSTERIMEVTTLTKLPRRIATFSKMNLQEAIKFNRTGRTYLSFNFVNYICSGCADVRDLKHLSKEDEAHILRWFEENVFSALDGFEETIEIKLLGTGKRIEDKIEVDWVS